MSRSKNLQDDCAQFETIKNRMLLDLQNGIDFSPKGSIDVPIRPIVDLINDIDSLVTTSSCSGRISIFRNDSSIGAKGINWLMVKHSMILPEDVITTLKTHIPTDKEVLTFLKCEGMILHVQCKDISTARDLHSLAQSSGFRESGISIGLKKIIVAIRTSSFGLEVPIAQGSIMIVKDEFIGTIVALVNERLRANFARIDRLLKALKQHYGWPYLDLDGSLYGYVGSRSVCDQQVFVERWGHILIPMQEGMCCVCIGGYGCDRSSSNPSKSHRRLPLQVIDSDTLQVTSTSADVDTDRVHGCGDMWKYSNSSGIVLIGGRRSPTETTLPFLQMFEKRKSTYIECTVVTSYNTYERACAKSSGDMDKTLTEDETNTSLVPQPRWGHTLTSIGENIFFMLGGRDSQQVFNDGYMLRLISFTTSAEVTDATNSSSHPPPVAAWEWKKIFDSYSIPRMPKCRFFHAACKVTGHCVEGIGKDEVERVAVLVHGGITSLDGLSVDSSFIAYYPFETVCTICSVDDDIAIDILLTDQIVQPSSLQIFGHSMIDIGYKTLLIIGGVNFDQESVGDGCIYDYGSDPFGYICLSRRRDLGLSLPCGECRTHHTSILCLDKKEGRKKSTKVLVMGGGAICLGFGAHFCVSLSIDVNFLFQSKKEIITSKQEKSHVVSEKNDVEMIKQVLNSTNRLLTVRGICVPKEKVKGLKIYLEQNNFLERSVRITVYTDSPLESLALEGFSECTVSPPSISTANLMVVPITSTFEQLLAVSNSTDISIALNRLLDTANVLFTTHLCPRTKSECLSRYSLVTSYIELFCKKYPQYAGSLNSRGGIIPLNGGKLKLETVGDVLMIPEDVLCISPWNEFVLEQQHGQQQDSKNNVPLLLLQDLWLGLATCFGVSRVARKAKIDSGPKRESRVRLLLPAVGISPKTGPGSPGWTTVIENDISFSFDITRVMFCSGNCTERMRMAKVAAKDECIVDLYVGVGYYTIPFILHAQAAHVHACEWNENSILALKENLASANIGPEKCTIYYGDNRLKETMDTLSGVADRVCLGLLPSSVQGWPLAVNALKCTGGMLHVHENVAAANIDGWVQSTCVKMEALLLDAGKSLRVTCVHLERVKSYAPKVFHIVADLACVNC